MKKRYNFDSPKNVKIKETLVDREVLLNQTFLVETLLEQGIIDISEIENFRNNETGEYKEIFEWWLISDWLAYNLRKYKEPIIQNEYGTWWGRTTTGQKIINDSIIDKICYDLEILEGQKNEWNI